eukprot:TRINITY_DN4524_c0_g1_i14.p2 TRINITY_DN4524_c0_g1~~TRINITY_DN4524_c0_g1_i14.p2  ORF type:complete len:273 (+),score=-17.37 TRINITY_DN4524_c0_g1_i14:440-1258(+)
MQNNILFIKNKKANFSQYIQCIFCWVDNCAYTRIYLYSCDNNMIIMLLSQIIFEKYNIRKYWQEYFLGNFQLGDFSINEQQLVISIFQNILCIKKVCCKKLYILPNYNISVKQYLSFFQFFQKNLAMRCSKIYSVHTQGMSDYIFFLINCKNKQLQYNRGMEICRKSTKTVLDSNIRQLPSVKNILRKRHQYVNKKITQTNKKQLFIRLMFYEEKTIKSNACKNYMQINVNNFCLRKLMYTTTMQKKNTTTTLYKPVNLSFKFKKKQIIETL